MGWTSVGDLIPLWVEERSTAMNIALAAVLDPGTLTDGRSAPVDVTDPGRLLEAVTVQTRQAKAGRDRAYPGVFAAPLMPATLIQEPRQPPAQLGPTVLIPITIIASAHRTVEPPGDDLVPRAHIVTDHAVTIDAPAAAVWPWLCQMGWHLGGYYTPQWVDRLLFRQNWPSLDRLDPALVRDLTVGDVIPDGGPGAVADAHLPPTWRDRFGAAIDWTWTFQLTPLPGQRTRLHLRVRARSAPWWLTVGYHAALVPADLIMAVGMLRGIKERAESARHWMVSGREPFSSAAPNSSA